MRTIIENILFIEIAIGVLIGMYLVKANTLSVIYSIEFAGAFFGLIMGVYLAIAHDLPTSSKYLSMLFLFSGASVIALLVIDRFLGEGILN